MDTSNFDPPTESPIDNPIGSHSVRGWIISLLLIVLGTIYITTFAGRILELLPPPFCHWSNISYKWLEPWWNEHVLVSSSREIQRIFMWLTVNWIAGFFIPAGLLLIFRRKLSDAGLGIPNIIGWRLVILSVLLSIPFGLLFLAADYVPRDVSKINFIQFICGLSIMIPEHFLICGTFTAILLPQRKLPYPVPVAPVEGHAIIRMLRWVGLAQPQYNNGPNRLLSWFGLTPISLFAISVSGIVFGMVHVGKDPLELILSFPGGVAVAYVTLRSHSIWPAIFAHWTMNLVPMALILIFV